MRASFDRIVVIFNPQSTGDGPQLAEQLHADLTRQLPEVPVRLCPTEHAGHARDLAREAAQTRTPRRRTVRVITLPHTAKWRILGVALRAATRGLGPQPTARHYAFTTLKPIPLQLDGELLALAPDTPVRIDIAPAALATLG